MRLVTVIGSEGAGRGVPAQARTVPIAKPFGVAVNGSGRIFVADPGQRGVVVYDRKAGSAVRWKGNENFPLGGPVSVAVHQDGRTFVSDGYRSEVVVFDSSGQPVGHFGANVLQRPHGIAVDSQRGRVYVADTRLHQVLIFNAATFQAEGAIGVPPQPGRPARQLFSSPSYVAVNSKGQVYVADMWICRIQAFGPDGTPLRAISTQCEGATTYDRAHAIAVDRRDRIYVADPSDNSLQIFQADGKLLEFVPGLKGRTGKGCVRTGIAVDRNDRIYLAEQLEGEGRVQVFARHREAR